jgi:hypothetical protein
MIIFKGRRRIRLCEERRLWTIECMIVGVSGLKGGKRSGRNG